MFGEIIMSFTARAPHLAAVTNVPYTVVPDPSWPAESVVIIDTASNKVIEPFRVDLNGYPLR